MTSRRRDHQLQLVDNPLPEATADAEGTEGTESARRRRSRNQFRIDARTRARGLQGVAAARAVLAQVPPPAEWVDHALEMHKAS